jgi:hypothetical protein
MHEFPVLFGYVCLFRRHVQCRLVVTRFDDDQGRFTAAALCGTIFLPQQLEPLAPTGAVMNQGGLRKVAQRVIVAAALGIGFSVVTAAPALAVGSVSLGWQPLVVQSTPSDSDGTVATLDEVIWT